MTLTDIPWEEFHQLDPLAKSRYLNQDDGRPFHTLLTQQFDRTALDTLGGLATRVRLLAKTKKGMAFLSGLLPHRRAMLYFTQPSTRTFLSFCRAV